MTETKNPKRLGYILLTAWIAFLALMTAIGLFANMSDGYWMNLFIAFFPSSLFMLTSVRKLLRADPSIAESCPSGTTL